MIVPNLLLFSVALIQAFAPSVRPAALGDVSADRYGGGFCAEVSSVCTSVCRSIDQATQPKSIVTSCSKTSHQADLKCTCKGNDHTIDVLRIIRDASSNTKTVTPQASTYTSTIVKTSTSRPAKLKTTVTHTDSSLTTILESSTDVSTTTPTSQATETSITSTTTTLDASTQTESTTTSETVTSGILTTTRTLAERSFQTPVARSDLTTFVNEYTAGCQARCKKVGSSRKSQTCSRNAKTGIYSLSCTCKDSSEQALHAYGINRLGDPSLSAQHTTTLKASKVTVRTTSTSVTVLAAATQTKSAETVVVSSTTETSLFSSTITADAVTSTATTETTQTLTQTPEPSTLVVTSTVTAVTPSSTLAYIAPTGRITLQGDAVGLAGRNYVRTWNWDDSLDAVADPDPQCEVTTTEHSDYYGDIYYTHTTTCQYLTPEKYTLLPSGDLAPSGRPYYTLNNAVTPTRVLATDLYKNYVPGSTTCPDGDIFMQNPAWMHSGLVEHIILWDITDVDVNGVAALDGYTKDSNGDIFKLQWGLYPQPRSTIDPSIKPAPATADCSTALPYSISIHYTPLLS